ncbi:hypothetical protein QOZ83_14330 [Romboutsia sedimentorum]|nr:hypothetical protein [Romboutsia sedimentorum]MDK2587035.1 hypothetical protein [Romboutsia sedimentorum]
MIIENGIIYICKPRFSRSKNTKECLSKDIFEIKECFVEFITL